MKLLHLCGVGHSSEVIRYGIEIIGRHYSTKTDRKLKQKLKPNFNENKWKTDDIDRNKKLSQSRIKLLNLIFEKFPSRHTLL